MNPTARYWMIGALFMGWLPHAGRLPGWLDLVMLLGLAWRLPAVERRIPLPGKLPLALMLFAGIAGLSSAYHTLLGPEAGVAFLIFCIVMKLLETREERDRYVVLVLAVFMLATIFLFEQGLGSSLYVMAGLTGIIAAFVAQNMPGKPPLFMLRKSLILVLQAIPLMVVLFVFFPRLPPLWSMKLTDPAGRTGMSDTMSPGDLAKLGQSDELAFRVEFGRMPVPPKSQMYWRGMTLSRFDGKTWRASVDYRMEDGGQVAWARQPLPAWVEPAIRVKSEQYQSYRVILEPTDHVWLYALNVPYSDTDGVGLARDFRLISQAPVYQRMTYDVRRYQPLALDPVLPDWLRRENLWLPVAGNPQARKMAREWRARYPAEMDYIQALAGWLRKANFYYTLEPPPLGENRVDEFLFRTRRGFCEHYASSFTFLLRAAGIPTRVVIGYQGGEPSPTGDSWQVRQLDAHAWVEAWVPGSGWQQIDPTAAVAPERIEKGMSELANNRQVWGQSTLSAVRFNNYRLLGNLRNMMDYVNYRWQRDVLGFDTDSQEAFLMRWLGDTSLWKRIAIGFSVLAALTLGFAAWTMLRHRVVRHPADRVVERLSRKLAARRLDRKTGEGVLAWMARLTESQPHWRKSADAFATEYARLRYAPGAEGKAGSDVGDLAQLLRTWPAWRPQKTQEVQNPLARSDGSS